MTGLKTYFPMLAIRLGESPVLLNEWMRALVDSNSLPSRKGRGPGSGVVLSGRSVATMLIAMMASEKRDKGIDRVPALLSYVPAGKNSVCRFTGAKDLCGAIGAYLERRIGPAERPAFLTVVQLNETDRDVVILRWRQGQKDYFQNYWPGDLGSPFEINRPAIRRHAVLSRGAIGIIADDVRGLLASEREEASR